jgi:hypothetical protein
MTFDTWLDTFVEEKGLDTEQMLVVEGPAWGDNHIPVGCVIELMKQAAPDEQRDIKNTIVQIDFRNGDVLHFFKHLAKAVAL